VINGGAVGGTGGVNSYHSRLVFDPLHHWQPKQDVTENQRDVLELADQMGSRLAAFTTVCRQRLQHSVAVVDLTDNERSDKCASYVKSQRSAYSMQLS